MTWGGRKVPRAPTCISPSPQMSPPRCLRSQAAASRGSGLPFLRSPCENKKNPHHLFSRGCKRHRAGECWEGAAGQPCSDLSLLRFEHKRPSELHEPEQHGAQRGAQQGILLLVCLCFAQSPT